MTRLLGPHRLWLVPGLALAIVANLQSTAYGLGLVPVILFGTLPHLPVLLGLGQPRPHGHIGTRAVPLFNALHQPLVPTGIVAVALTGILAPIWLVAGLAWMGHIILDRGLGDGLRDEHGARRTGPRTAFSRTRGALTIG